jgi:hypothetical protein
MAKSVLDVEEARRLTADGLRLCLAGDEAAGIARYRGCLLPEIAGQLGLRVHLKMMEGAGKTAAAEQLRAMLLRKGNDISYAAVGPHASPEDAVREYEDWFARGIGNAVMIEGYLRALHGMGRTDRVVEMFDTSRLLHRVTIGDHAAVARMLLDAEPELTYGSETITRQMRYVHRVERMGNPVYDALLAEIRTEILAHCARWAASDHPLAGLAPKDVTLRAWAMIARAEGHNVRHVHPYGWVTAIYYPMALPEGSIGGQLRVGGWEDPAPPGWPDVSIAPEPGLLVILPSWYVHWTEPTGAEGPRLAITTEAVAA